MNNQQKQHIGDALFTLLAREYYHSRAEVKNKFDYSKVNVMCNRICNNSYMGQLAVKLGVLSTFEVYNKSKRGGNEFEQYVYELYTKHGIDYMKKWFSNTIVPIFNEVNKINNPS